MRRQTLWIVGGAVVAALAVGGLWYALAQGQGAVQFPDIHGMGFSSDGARLVVAVHDGVRIYENGEWHDPPDIPRHDYMGYSPVDEGFFSSGHPGPSINRVNPFGLVKSADGGRTLTTLGFEGESDFHIMAVGYKSHAIYVFNPRPNSRLSVGLHYSLDDGQTWQASAGLGILGDIRQIAVHPTDASRVAVAAEGGVFLSSDHGNTFERIGQVSPVTAVTFGLGAEALLFGHTSLYRYDLTGGQLDLIQIPGLSGDAIGFIASNPATDEIAFATFGKDVYLSGDGGASREQIARDGVGKN